MQSGGRGLWNRLGRLVRGPTLWLLLVGALFAGGVIWAGNAAIEYTQTNQFCGSCHVMRATVMAEYEKSSHYKNALGIRATCADCHIPKAFIPHMERKIGALKFVWAWLIGVNNTPAKLRAHRKELAEVVWAYMKADDSRECRSCHTMDAMELSKQPRSTREEHESGFKEGQTCIDCHNKGLVHQRVVVAPPAEQPGGFQLE